MIVMYLMTIMIDDSDDDVIQVLPVVCSTDMPMTDYISVIGEH